jgi:hypothetical protein
MIVPFLQNLIALAVAGLMMMALVMIAITAATIALPVVAAIAAADWVRRMKWRFANQPR